MLHTRARARLSSQVQSVTKVYLPDIPCHVNVVIIIAAVRIIVACKPDSKGPLWGVLELTKCELTKCSAVPPAYENPRCGALYGVAPEGVWRSRVTFSA